MNKWLKPALFLIFIVFVCSVLSRVLTSGETLSEYAAHNPETAYAAPEVSAAPSASPTALSTAPPEASPSPTPSASPAPTFSPLAEESKDSVHYEDGFFYQPLTAAVTARITGLSYPVTESIAPALSLQAVNVVPDDAVLAISYDDLRYLNVLYYHFDGNIQLGVFI